MTTAGTISTKEHERRVRSLCTGLLLASIALAFFLGFLLRRIYQ